MTRVTRAIIIGGWIVVGLAVAVIWPFVALCSILAGVSLFFVSHLLRLAKGRPAPTNNPTTNNRRPIMATTRKIWRVTATALVSTHEGGGAHDLHNGIEMLYQGGPLPIEDLEVVRLVPEPIQPDLSAAIIEAQRRADGDDPTEQECVAHLRSLGFDVQDVADLPPDQQIRPHNSIAEVVGAIAGAFKIAEAELEPGALAASDSEGGEE